jgi:hypothetical protein
MKKTIILSTIILFSVMMIGCSDNMSLIGPDKQTNSSGIKNQEKQTNNLSTILQPREGNYELIWHSDELIVNTENGALLENMISYYIIPDNPNSYLIRFSGKTNADRYTNGYLPVVEISKNDVVELQLSGMSSINKSTELRLNNVSASELRFYIALFEVDGNGQKQPLKKSKSLSDPDNSCTLKLSDLRIYIIH